MAEEKWKVDMDKEQEKNEAQGAAALSQAASGLCVRTLIGLLRVYGGVVNLGDDESNTPLHYALGVKGTVKSPDTSYLMTLVRRHFITEITNTMLGAKT